MNTTTITRTAAGLMILLTLLLGGLLAIPAGHPARADTWTPAPGDEHWVEGFNYPVGFSQYVSALTTDQHNTLYASGMYSPEFGMQETVVASWDGIAWSKLGILAVQDIPGGIANDLLIDTDGSLYVGGQFTSVYIYDQPDSNVIASNISHWDGSTWSALGSGVNGTVYALTIDGDNKLYAGGSFTSAGEIEANNIACWDGFTWTAVGSGLDGTVVALAIDGDGILYAGGEFLNLGTQYISHIARWDGVSWSPMEEAGTDVIHVLVLDNAGNLYASGIHRFVNGDPVSMVSRWDGDSWSVITSDLFGTVSDIVSDSTGRLYIGGEFSYIGTEKFNHIAHWDGLNWKTLGGGVDASLPTGNFPIHSLAVDQNDLLYVGGDFWQIGSVQARAVAQWDGATWYSLGDIASGMDAWVSNLKIGDENKLYAGGFFNTGDTWGVNFARWEGSRWFALGEDIEVNYQFPDAMVVDQVSGDIYAGISNLSDSSLFYFNGINWDEIISLNDVRFFALALDERGELYMGGSFASVDGVLVNNIAHWNGSEWTPLGNGVVGEVYAIALDAYGNLYAGGLFTEAGGIPASNIARWDGTSWSALGAGIDGRIYTLALDPMGNLYAGGAFTGAGGQEANSVARWDGTSWTPMGAGLAESVAQIVVDQANNVYAGGSFITAGDRTFNNIARWDGVEWQPLGSGLDYWVFSMASDAPGSLYVGGLFSKAGDKDSSFIGQWRDAPPEAVDDIGAGFTTDKANAFTTGSVLLNDFDPDYSDTITLIGFDASLTTGMVTSNGDGTFNYDPGGQFDALFPGQQAVDTFEYTLSDGVLTATATVTVTITGVNETPSVAINPLGLVAEGTPVEFSAAFIDPGLANRLVSDGEIMWDFGDGLTTTGVLTPTHTYADNGLYPVTLSVVDPLGGSGQNTLPLEVQNVSPTVDLLLPASVLVYDALSLRGSITDPGWLDTHTVRVEWQAGVIEYLVLPPGELNFSASHSYMSAGEHILVVTIIDKDGGAVIERRTVTVDLLRWFLPLLRAPIP